MARHNDPVTAAMRADANHTAAMARRRRDRRRLAIGLVAAALTLGASRPALAEEVGSGLLAAVAPALKPAPQSIPPNWVRYAVPSPPTGNRPLIAIVIDDMGLDRGRTAIVTRLSGPLTTSFMTFAGDLPALTAAARQAGHELLLHVPMEADSLGSFVGPQALLTGESDAEILGRLRWGMARFDGFVGINNHMGSKFTANVRGMTRVMEELSARGLLFLDSRTARDSVGLLTARTAGVPHAGRDVFLDDSTTPAAIAASFAELERIARQRGSAIASGHPSREMISALAAWLPTLESKGLALVPLSTIVKYRIEHGTSEQ